MVGSRILDGTALKGGRPLYKRIANRWICRRHDLIKMFVGDWVTSTGPEIRIYRRPGAAPAETRPQVPQSPEPR
mgnify:CR=1 FL=1